MDAADNWVIFQLFFQKKNWPKTIAMFQQSISYQYLRLYFQQKIASSPFMSSSVLVLDTGSEKLLLLIWSLKIDSTFSLIVVYKWAMALTWFWQSSLWSWSSHCCFRWKICFESHFFYQRFVIIPLQVIVTF